MPPSVQRALSSAGARKLAKKTRVLGDIHRVRILSLLAKNGEMNVREVRMAIGLSQPATSHHLKILLEAGLVKVRRSGVYAWYSHNPTALTRLMKAMAAATGAELT